MVSYPTRILVVSDRVSKGLATDQSGPAIQQLLEEKDGFQVSEVEVVPDEVVSIQSKVLNWAASYAGPQLIITCGGTGFGVRDVTPEAVSSILDKPAPGLVTSMLLGGLSSTPFAALSRPVAGVIRNSLILTLPGSPKGACENLSVVLPILPHALKLAGGDSVDPHPDLASLASGSIPQSITHSNSKGFTSCPHGHQKVSTGVSTVAQRPRQSPHPLVEFELALDKVLALSKHLSAKWQPVKLKLDDPKLHGSVLAETILALEPVPGYRASIVDGYAVHSCDGPGVYPVMGVSLAEPLEENGRLRPGHVMRISTGAPVPEGADAVVMVEHTELDGAVDGVEETVQILQTVSAGNNIRPIGSDLAQGSVVLPKGHRIDALLGWGADLGLLASSGLQQFPVYPLPRIGVLSSGSEVVGSDCDKLKLGQVRDANRPTIIAALKANGFDSEDLGIVSDSRDALENALKLAFSRVDVVITSGGVSMGEADLIKPILLDPPFKLQFGRVNIKPGKPTTFATFHRTLPTTDENLDGLVFALPGNPVSAAVALNLFVLPSLLSLINHPQPVPPRVKVTLLHDINLDSRPEFVRAVYGFDSLKSPGLVARSTGNQISSRLLSFNQANALLVLPPSGEVEVLKSGSKVDAILIGQPVHSHLL